MLRLMPARPSSGNEDLVRPGAGLLLGYEVGAGPLWGTSLSRARFIDSQATLRGWLGPVLVGPVVSVPREEFGCECRAASCCLRIAGSDFGAVERVGTALIRRKPLWSLVRAEARSLLNIDHSLGLAPFSRHTW